MAVDGWTAGTKVAFCKCLPVSNHSNGIRLTCVRTALLGCTRPLPDLSVALDRRWTSMAGEGRWWGWPVEGGKCGRRNGQNKAKLKSCWESRNACEKEGGGVKNRKYNDGICLLLIPIILQRFRIQTWNGVADESEEFTGWLFHCPYYRNRQFAWN